MGLFRRVVRAVTRPIRRAVDGAIDAGKGFLKKTIAKGIEKIRGPIMKVLDKVPFGNVLKGYVEKFLNNPFGLLGLGPLAGLGGMLAGTTQMSQLTQAAQAISGTSAFAQSPQARANAMQLIARQQARLFFP